MAVNVKFSGDTADLTKSVAEMQTKLGGMQGTIDELQSHIQSFGDDFKEMADKAGEAIGQVGDAFKGLNDTIQKGGASASTGWVKMLLGGGVAGAATAGVVSILNSIGKEFLDVERNAREASVSLERFQELQYALNQSGAGTDKMVSGLQEASKKLNDLSHDAGELGKFLDANNVKWKDAAGHIIDMNQYLDVSARLIANAANEGDRFKAGELLGFSREWVRVLQGGPVALQQLSKEAHDAGAVFDKELIHRSNDLTTEWNKASLQWSILFKEKIIEVTPYVVQLVDFLGKALSYVGKIATDLGHAFKEDFEEAFAGAPLKIDAASVMPGTMQALLSSMREFQDVSNNTQVTWDKIAADATALQKDVMRSLVDSFPKKGTVFPGDPDRGGAAAEMREIEGEIQVLRQGLEQKKLIFDAEAKQWDLTQNRKFGALQQATEQEYQAELALLQKEANIGDLSVAQKARVLARIKELQAKHETDMVKLDEQSIAAQQALWTQYMNTVTSAFNSQLRGLIAGTTSWSTAMKNILVDLLVKFIEVVEGMVVKWIAAEVAKTTATTTGAAARATAESAAAGTGLLAQIGNAVAVIMADAAKTFAGVFAFLSPAMGPAAAGPAAASSASVAAAASAVPALAVGTDMVLTPGLAFLHAGESVVPAAQTSGPFTGAGLGGGASSPTINISFTANGRLTRAEIMQNAHDIAKAVSDVVNRNPSLRPRFA